MTFNDNPVAMTRYIPLRLCDRPQEPTPPPATLPVDLMTPPANAIPRPKPTEQREENHDHVPDTGSLADRSVADISCTSESINHVDQRDNIRYGLQQDQWQF